MSSPLHAGHRLPTPASEDSPAQTRRDRERLDMLVNQASVGISQRSLDGTLTLANQRFCDIVGRPLEGVLGQTHASFTHPEDRDSSAAQFQRLLETGEAFTVEKRYLRPDGATVWVNNHVSLARDDAGRPEFIICVTHDISDRKRAEQRLQEGDERLRLAQEAGGVGLFTYELATHRIHVTPQFCHLFGLEPVESLPIADVEALIHPEDRHLASTAEMRLSGQLTTAVEYRIRQARTGAVRWISRRADLFRDTSGKPLRLIGVVQDVTEHRASEDALRQANEQIQLVLNSSAVIGAWQWDVPNNRITGDERFAQSFGFTPEQAAQGAPLKAFVESIHPEDRDRTVALISRTLETGGPYRHEYRVRHARGEYLWVEATGYCVVDAQGKPLRFPGLLIDIDERKQAELRQSVFMEISDRLRDMTDTADIAGAVMPRVGKLFHALRAGYGSIDSQQELVNMEREWVAGPDVSSVAGIHRFSDYGVFIENLKRGETIAIPDIEKDPRTAPGAANLLGIGIRALLNVPLMEQGRFVAVLYVHDAQARRWNEDEIEFVRNVADRIWTASERIKAMEQLRRANETLEQRVEERTRERDRVWNVSQDLLVVADYEGRFVSVNPAWSAILGWEPEELLGKNSQWLEHPEDHDKSRAEREHLSAGERTQQFENRLRHKDGTYRLLSWTAVAVPERRLVYSSARDITEQRKIEEQLRQSQKMEAVGKLTGGVAHDFNNLLQVISGNLQLLQRDVAGNERGTRRVQTAIGSVERGARLASQLLAFARRQPLAPVVIHLGRLVRGMDDLLRRSLGEDIEVETVISGGLWNTAVDPNQLENVILNLAINARDAMHNTGKLTIEVSNAMLDDRYALTNPEVQPGQYVLLAVSDTGGGMTPEVMERAFEPFFTTKAEGRGTGLGLSMVYGFVKQSGGHVKIYSEVGHGTTLKIYLPRTFDSELPLAGDVVTGPIEGGHETILVVEDDAEVRGTVVEILTELGYRVLKAQDGQSAMAILQSGLLVDLLFTDVVMPGPVRSPDLARQAKALLPDIEVLFTSGYTENAIVHGGRLDPGVHLLSKPHRREDLARKLRQLLDQRAAKLRGKAPTPPPLPAPAPVVTPKPGPLRVLLVEDDEDIRMSALELMDLLGHEVVALPDAESAIRDLPGQRFDVLFTDVTLPGKSGVELAREVRQRYPEMKIIIASGHGRAVLSAEDARMPNLWVLPKPYALPQIQEVLLQVALAS
ncbi:PAS domain S-box protein [Archangium primigenium]|nr:PAS domain S-box protein [Archangium primigenium]